MNEIHRCLSASVADNARAMDAGGGTGDGPIDAAVLTGTIGVGKTTVAEAISDSLHRAGHRHALLDLDWLGQLYPPVDPSDPYRLDLALANLAQIVPNFVAAGARRFVIAATITSREELAGLRSSLPAGRLTVVLLTAPPEIVAARIQARDSGAMREDFLARTEALAEKIRSAGEADLVVDAGARPPDEVAAEILERLGWPAQTEAS
jgi:chloramphenicol 3-O-phosphotransferase